MRQGWPWVGWMGMGTIGLALGCNAVLDNASGELAPPDAASALPDASIVQDSAPAATEPSDAMTPVPEPVPDAAVPDLPDSSPPPSSGDAGTVPTCGLGEKLCSGACAPVDDPFFGCLPSGCTPCSLAHATPACAGAACAVAQCDPGYADCDHAGANGCEVDLSQPSHCGACNARCAPAAPNCAPTSAGFACTTGCTASAPTLCGNQCVNLLTSVDNCGACANACRAVAQGTDLCSSGHCGFVCRTGFHVCGAACASNLDPATCGASCAACTAGANAIATCNGTACGTECKTNYADCNGNPADGCEASLLTDPLDCGKCGVSCNGRSCIAGTCAPPPPPPDAGPPADAAPPPPPDAGQPADSATAPPADAATGGG